MGKTQSNKQTRKKGSASRGTPSGTSVRRLALWGKRLVWASVLLPLALILLFSFVNPPVTPYMIAERGRQGPLTREWVSLDDIAPVMARSAVAAEDARFCRHWGFDLPAIRAALADGGARGGSTISQQVVKNVFLWHGRSWLRKSLEALITPIVELTWSKKRILEVYLNVAEFDHAVFGIEAGAQRYFGVSAKNLNATQAARLAMILPNPKGRDAANPRPSERRRARQILDGAATIRNTDRAACFAP